MENPLTFRFVISPLVASSVVIVPIVPLRLVIVPLVDSSVVIVPIVPLILTAFTLSISPTVVSNVGIVPMPVNSKLSADRSSKIKSSALMSPLILTSP